MRFICDNCKAKYSIADEKIKKKVLKIRCKKCSHVIIVRDTTPKAASPSVHSSKPKSTPARPLQSSENAPSPFQSHTQLPQVVPTHLGPASSEESDVGERTVVARISSEWFQQLRAEKKEEPIWFMALQGAPVGPVVLSDVHNRIRTQELSEHDLVWCAGWADWIPAATVDELKASFAQRHETETLAPPPVRVKEAVPPAPKPQPKEPKVEAPQETGLSDFFQKAQKDSGAIGKSTPTPTPEPITPVSPTPVEASPLAALAQKTQDALPTSGKNIATPSGGLAIQKAAPEPISSAPSDLFAGSSAPQPPLSELAPAPTPAKPAARVLNNQQDIAHEQQARPAVEFVETNAEENFFSNDSAQKTDDDLFEVALPPLPHWDSAEEIDADDIIEINDAIKPNWSKRLLLGGGTALAITFMILGMSAFVGKFKDPVVQTHTDSGQKTAKDTQKNSENKVVKRKRGATQSALLGDSSPAAQPTKKKVKTRRRSYKTYRKRTPKTVARIRPSKRKVSDDIQAAIYAQYQKKLGTKSSSKNSIRGTQSGASISPALKKRIYKEIERNRTQVRYCYEQYLKKAYLHGRMSIRIRIEPDGTVSNVRTLTSKFRRLAITKCITRKMRRWRFASFTGTPFISINIPFLLQTSGF